MIPSVSFTNLNSNNLIFFYNIFIVVIFWSLIWKGIALWKAARNNSKPWYVVLLIVNTLGILEILYIFVFSPKNQEKV
ncbi:MAG: hypothetical protein US94_C0007G0004 [Berkelbacteria bacterium GW2011_GWB1_38_5]|uniref:DUF5652 domain-containing protein n=1 Tax=Berkelbacteria bacterium GW2011_GWB1_38_5 TaxID=1618336 RepID=A0A0G0K674_9BACT|nr:MAG: hypothetical protein US94_C0007G0004 [Berkelbacteria bacterium GW2011_GWB1_38_5]